MTLPVLFLLLWLASLPVCIGLIVADTYGRWPLTFNYRETLGFGIFIWLFGGPFSAIAMFLITGFAQHGMSFRNPETRRREIG